MENELIKKNITSYKKIEHFYQNEFLTDCILIKKKSEKIYR